MLGIDIVENARFIAKQNDIGFLSKFLSDEELKQLNDLSINHIEYIASRFAAKEAVVKALKGNLLKYIYSNHFSILRVKGQAPNVYISEEFLNKINQIFNKKSIEISISHEKLFSVAIAMLI